MFTKIVKCYSMNFRLHAGLFIMHFNVATDKFIKLNMHAFSLAYILLVNIPEIVIINIVQYSYIIIIIILCMYPGHYL